jgi:hypothetical protein
MDWLAVFVICAIVGQLCLPLVGAYRNDRAQSRAKRRADLLEAAADQQLSKIPPTDLTIKAVTEEPSRD